MAGRRACGSAVRPQLRGGRRKQHPPRRQGLGGVSSPKSTGATPWEGMRHWNMESIYEYGARAGFWRHPPRIRRCRDQADGLWRRHRADALARAGRGDAGARLGDRHARPQMDRLPQPHARGRGRRHGGGDPPPRARSRAQAPTGWYTGRCSINTVRPRRRGAAISTGVADTYDDDLPYWHDAHMDGTPGEKPQLILPYTLDANDMRFAIVAGYDHGEPFYRYLCDSIRRALRGRPPGAPKMMNIGLHCRLIGRPGRIVALQRFMEHVQKHDKVWVPTRVEIAAHWRKAHPYAPRTRPSRMARADFVAALSAASSSIRPGSPSAPSTRASAPPMTAPSACTTRLTQCSAPPARTSASACCSAHPDLAGKLAQAQAAHRRNRPPSRPPPGSTR